MKLENALNIVNTIRQGHLLRYLSDLSENQKLKLVSQIEALDQETLQQQQKLVRLPQQRAIQNLKPVLKNFSTSGNTADFEHGKSMIAAGLVGCLVVAGGQGTRLRFDGPKGMCPVTLVKKKSLFQLLSEKTLAAGKQAGRPLNLAMMTSRANHATTINFFEKHHYFGLDPSQITFYCQKSLPLLDKNGNLFLESKDTIAEGPDGNGGALHEFYRQGVWNKWHTQGIRFINFILIDNPLADPFDAELVGFHDRKGSDIIVKATERRNPSENVGVLVNDGDKFHVVEYSELSEKDRGAVDETGNLRYRLANISLFSFGMNFVKTAILQSKMQMPLHKALKAVKHLNAAGETVLSDIPMAWKFERFIFDLLPVAKTVDALIYQRESCFAPLKNYTGSDSLETVGLIIESSDRRVLNEITGTECSGSPLEISQDFYYPTADLFKAWKGRKITEGGYLSYNKEV